jgi:hypothetical protein
MNPPLHLGFGAFTYSQAAYPYWMIAIFGIVGFFGGLAGALFNAVNTRLTTWRFGMAPLNQRWRTRSLVFKLCEALIVSLTVSSVAFGLPSVAGTCFPKPVITGMTVSFETPPVNASVAPQVTYIHCKTGLESTANDTSGGTYIHPTPPDILAQHPSCNMYVKRLITVVEESPLDLNKLVQLYCPAGQYNDLASLYLSDSESAIRLLFHLKAYLHSIEIKAAQLGMELEWSQVASHASHTATRCNTLPHAATHWPQKLLTIPTMPHSSSHAPPLLRFRTGWNELKRQYEVVRGHSGYLHGLLVALLDLIHAASLLDIRPLRRLRSLRPFAARRCCVWLDRLPLFPTHGPP